MLKKKNSLLNLLISLSIVGILVSGCAAPLSDVVVDWGTDLSKLQRYPTPLYSDGSESYPYILDEVLERGHKVTTLGPLIIAANQGDVDSMLLLATMYYEGAGVANLNMLLKN